MNRRTLRGLASRWWLLLLSLPFLMRWLYSSDVRSSSFLQWNLVVSLVNDRFARDLISGEGAPWMLFRSPWYPLFLSWIYRVLGDDAMTARMVQWGLGGLTCLLVAATAACLYDRKRAIVALVAATLYAPSFFYEGELLEQAPATFFVVLGLSLLAWGLRSEGHPRRHLSSVAASACAFGAAILMRPELAAAVPFLAAALLAPAPAGGAGAPRRAWSAGLFGLTCLAALGTLTVPRIVLDVSGNHAGINAAVAFHLGNNAVANGHDSVFEDTSELPPTDPEALRHHMTGIDVAGIRYARERTGGDLDTVARYWLRRTFDEIAGNPVRYLGLLLRKGLLYVNGYPHTTQKEILIARDFSPTLSALVFNGWLCVPVGLLVPLAVAGIAATRGAARKLLVLALPLGGLVTTLLFTHDARFQHPAAVAALAPAAHGLLALVESLAARRLVLPMIFAGMLVLSNADLLGTHTDPAASGYFRVGTMHLERGEPRAAAAAFVRSIQADPAFVPSLDNLVAACRGPQGCPEAIGALEKLRRDGHRSFDLLRTVAELQIAAGRAFDAAEAARQAVDLHPDRAEAYRLLERALRASGEPAAAVEALRAGVLRLPRDPGLRLDLGAALMQQGRTSEALEELQRTLRAGGAPPQAFAYAGYCLVELGRLAEASSLLAEGRGLHPRDVTILGLLGQVEGRLGRRVEERECYRAVLAIDPGHAEASYRLALSLAKGGDRQEALDLARRARDAGHPLAGPLVGELERGRP